MDTRHPDLLLGSPALSRRAALARWVGGGLGLAVAARGLAAVAQEATPVSIPPIAAAWAEAWTARDVDALLALYAEDALYEEVPFGMAVRGKDGIRAAVEEELAAFTDIAVTLSAGFQAGGWAAAEGTFGGAYTGQAEGLPPGTGQRTEVRFVAIFELEGDLIRRESDYFDAFTLLTQLGILGAEGEGAPEGTPTA